MRCVITGASGLIGRALMPVLADRHFDIVPWGRRANGFDLAEASSLGAARWERQLVGVDTVVHLAALVHQLNSKSQRTFSEYQQINCAGTLQLAKAAAAAGVKRFVFLSSAKVFGEGSDEPYRVDSSPQPSGGYAQSKWQAEQALVEFANASSMSVAIVRPPLVYGPGVKANFRALLRLALLPLPLPLASVDNRRDMVSVDNLVDMIARSFDVPLVGSQLLLCSDGAPYSLAQVIATIRAARGHRAWLYPLPKSLVKSAARWLQGSAVADRLFGDFEVDIEATCNLLDWRPKVSMISTLQRTLRETG